jgi:hypothetical protein
METKIKPLRYTCSVTSQPSGDLALHDMPRYDYESPVTVAVRSEAWVLAGWLLGSWVRIPLKAWMFILVFLCCVVLCK